MRSIVLAVLVLAACTKPNPNVCCTDEADCNAKGIPLGSQCEDGLLCRGNQCIAQPCGSSAECDSSAPYCVADTCGESCNEDAQCPGFSQAADQLFCETGACVECRAGMNQDCASAKPVCDLGTCRGCRAHDECASGVCGDDGTCIDESNIAYVDPTGSGAAACTVAAPCSTVTRALTMPQPYILISSGTYSSGAALDLGGQRHLIGRGATPPIFTRTNPGPIIDISNGQIDLDYIQVSGATSDTELGNGIYCHLGNNAPTVRLRRVTATMNEASGLDANSCTVEATNSTFSKNGFVSGRFAIHLSNATGTFDSCIVSENIGGMDLDGGLYKVTNNLIVRNYSPTTPSTGINLYTTEAGTKLEFNTIVDNGTGTAVLGQGINCNLQGVTASFPNNIIARNTKQTAGANCSYPSSIIVDTDITQLKFKSPDAAPYDYHIDIGSMAIDAATLSTVDHDVDGQARPNGAGRDVGADEFIP